MEHLIIGLYIFVAVGYVIGFMMVILVIKSTQKDNDRMIDILTTIEESEEEEWKRPS